MLGGPEADPGLLLSLEGMLCMKLRVVSIAWGVVAALRLRPRGFSGRIRLVCLLTGKRPTWTKGTGSCSMAIGIAILVVLWVGTLVCLGVAIQLLPQQEEI